MINKIIALMTIPVIARVVRIVLAFLSDIICPLVGIPKIVYFFFYAPFTMGSLHPTAKSVLETLEPACLLRSQCLWR